MSTYIGTTLIGYTILREIGEGGMGKVYLAENQMIGQQVAIKILDPILARNPDLRERFAQEARIQVALQHQNIVRVLNAQSSEELSFLIMEYIEGQSLDKVLKRRGKLSVDESIRIFSQVLDAVGYAHAKGIIHRDLKPSNIMVCADGTTKVTDFGIAKVLGDTKLTRTGTSMGSPDYMSPEQVLGKTDIDHRTDIYSLGATLYEMLTGRPPFVIENGGTSDSDFLVKQAHVQDTPLTPCLLNSSIPLEIAQTILRALNKACESRHSSCQDFRKDILSTDLKSRAQDFTASPAASKVNLASMASKKTSKKIFLFGSGWSVAVAISLTIALVKIFNWHDFSRIVCKIDLNICEPQQNMIEVPRDDKYTREYEKLFDAIISNNREMVADFISYPLFRPLPLPPIRNRSEFLEKYSSFFDKELISEIKNKEIDTFANWKGRSFLSGKIWMSEGKIKSLNYMTEEGRKNLQLTVIEDKKTLHHSAAGYDDLLLFCRTKSHIIRIQSLGRTIAYFSWKMPKSLSDKPSLQIVRELGTTLNFDSSEYRFKSGQYSYEISKPRVCSEERCSINITVYKGQDEIQTEQCD